MRIEVTNVGPDAVNVSGTPLYKIVKVDAGLTVTGGAVNSVNGRFGDVTGLLDANRNLSDLTDTAAARSSLGLGAAATLGVGTTTGTVAAGNDTRITGAAQKASNLSDLGSAATARTNLGLGGAATLNVGTTTGTVAAGDDSRLTNPRTPTAHATTHATGGSDPITPAQIGALTQAVADLRYLLLAGGSLTGALGGGQGETFDRWRIDTVGKLGVGPGSATRDTFWERKSGGGWLSTGDVTTGTGNSFYGQGSTSMPPSANGLLGWSYDVAAAINNITLTAGTVYLSKIWINRTGTVNTLATRTAAQAGAGLANSYMGLYDANGNRLGVTADLSTSWAGSTGNRTHALTAAATINTPGWYYVAWLIGTLTTSPGFARSSGIDVQNINCTPATYRSASYSSGLTALPATITMASLASFTSYLWAGVF